LNLGRIRAAVADLGRLLQKVCASPEQQSGILLRPRESGVDLAIVDSGRLLLDARPVENMDVERMHDYVQGRLALFERFYRQHSVSGIGQLEQIILCGERQITLALEERFRASELRVTVLDDALQESSLQITADGSVSEFGGAAILLWTVAAKPVVVLPVPVANSAAQLCVAIARCGSRMTADRRCHIA
jgi:hypothetical protein